MIKAKVPPKHGKSNNKKKTKFCDICSSWISYKKWKKHQEEHEATSRNTFETSQSDPNYGALSSLRSDYYNLQKKHEKLERELEAMKDAFSQMGRVIAISYQV
jgi:hypothetical protein